MQMWCHSVPAITPLYKFLEHLEPIEGRNLAIHTRRGKCRDHTPRGLSFWVFMIEYISIAPQPKSLGNVKAVGTHYADPETVTPSHTPHWAGHSLSGNQVSGFNLIPRSLSVHRHPHICPDSVPRWWMLTVITSEDFWIGRRKHGKSDNRSMQGVCSEMRIQNVVGAVL
jgi:hypothetical protein